MVEWVVGVLLELLADLVNLLLSSQTLLVLHLLQSSLLKRSVCSLEAPLRVAIHLVLTVACDVQSVEGVIDTGGIESARLRVERAKRRVNAAGLLLGFGVLALGL